MIKFKYDQKVWFIEKKVEKKRVKCDSCGAERWEKDLGNWEVIGYRDWNAGGGLGSPVHKPYAEPPHKIQFISIGPMGVRYSPCHQSTLKTYELIGLGFLEKDIFLTKEEAQEECNKRNKDI